VVFESQLDELRRAADGTIKAIDRTSAELDAIKQTLVRSRADTALYEIADSIQERMLAERDRLIRNEISSFFQESSDVTLTERLWHARFNAASTAYGPTPSQRTSYAIGRRLYDDVVQRLGVLVDTEYEGLKEALDMAEVPWTPGRGVQ